MKNKRRCLTQGAASGSPGPGRRAGRRPQVTALFFMSGIILLAPWSAWAEPGIVDSMRMTRMAEKSNKQFHEGKYDGARAGYMRAKDMAGEPGWAPAPLQHREYFLQGRKLRAGGEGVPAGAGSG